MIDLFGTSYYIDLDSIDKLVTLESKNNREDSEDGTPEPKTIDGIKYELINYFINMVMEPTIDEDIDEKLGFNRAISKTSIGFKIAFNTLLKYNILKEID